MAQTKESVLALLKDNGVQFELFDHEPVMTCEAQVRLATAAPAGRAAPRLPLHARRRPRPPAAAADRTCMCRRRAQPNAHICFPAGSGVGPGGRQGHQKPVPAGERAEHGAARTAAGPRRAPRGASAWSSRVGCAGEPAAWRRSRGRGRGGPTRPPSLSEQSHHPRPSHSTSNLQTPRTRRSALMWSPRCQTQT